MNSEADALACRQRYRGLIGVKSNMPIRDISVLSRIYTPGVGAVCREIEKSPISSYSHTCSRSLVSTLPIGTWNQYHPRRFSHF
jgi:malate dehydrogenase (oxaloacetate-decarboxylating)